MATVEEMRECITAYCTVTKCCDCPIHNDKSHVIGQCSGGGVTDDIVRHNYELIFGKEEDTMKTKLINVEVKKCEDGIYLALTYEQERQDGTYHIIYPKVTLPFRQSELPNEITNSNDCVYLEHAYKNAMAQIDVIYEFMNYEGDIAYNVRGYKIEIKVKDKPKKKMTIEEIEKVLGYGVEIISSERTEPTLNEMEDKIRNYCDSHACSECLLHGIHNKLSGACHECDDLNTVKEMYKIISESEV